MRPIEKFAAASSGLDLLYKEISTLPKVTPGYQYPGEGGINPAYCDIDACEPLCPDEKRIWALRTDGVLATGIKNVCVREGNTDLWQKVDATAHVFLDRNNRYGHPSLAMPEGEYDGSVYYAGWVCQRPDHLQIFLQSGRFRTETAFTEDQRERIETYVAYKFMHKYQQSKVLFYDRIGEEFLSAFLAGPFDSARPCRVYTWETVENNLKKTEIALYEKMMEAAQTNMMASIEKLIAEHILPGDSFETAFISEIGKQIKHCFDEVMYRDAGTNSEIKKKLKQAIKQLIDAGVPFVNDRQLLIWSTRFARNEAEKFAAGCNGTTDGMSQDVLRKILLGWPDGKLNVLFDLVKNPSPVFPKLSQLFWAAMSELFMEELKEGSPVHIFFQDALTIGNYCWEYELPVARSKKAMIYLHRYDFQSGSWEDGVLFDSPASDHIPVRRRVIHPLDTYRAEDIEMKDGYLLWQQEFKDNKLDQEINHWKAPRILTLGKLKSFMQKMKPLNPSPLTKSSNTISHK